jgi:hypothetical protein
MPALFINTHRYNTTIQGVHGAYWALVSNDKENCGVIDGVRSRDRYG